MCAGKLEELSLPQRERVLEYLLQRLHLFQGLNNNIIGIARPSTSANNIVLPPLQLPKPSVLKSIPCASAWAPQFSALESAPSSHILSISVSTQTAHPGLESADQLLKKVLSDVRPWGGKATNHPLSITSKHAGGGPHGDRSGVSTRGSATATPPHFQTGHHATSHFRPAEPPMPGPYRQIAAGP